MAQDRNVSAVKGIIEPYSERRYRVDVYEPLEFAAERTVPGDLEKVNIGRDQEVASEYLISRIHRWSPVPRKRE